MEMNSENHAGDWGGPDKSVRTASKVESWEHPYVMMGRREEYYRSPQKNQERSVTGQRPYISRCSNVVDI